MEELSRDVQDSGSGEMLGYSQVARSSTDVAVHLLCVIGPKESYCVQVPTRY